MIAAQPVVYAEGPDLEIGEDPVNPREHDVGGHLADNMRIVGEAGSAGAALFRSLVELQAAINRYLGEHNHKPRPFVWTAYPDRIIEKLSRRYQVLASDH